MESILTPGYYMIEMEFERPVEPSVLQAALTRMGFGLVVYDQSVDVISTGALPLGSVTSSPVASKALTASNTPASIAQAIAAQAVQAAAAAAKAAADAEARRKAAVSLASVQARTAPTTQPLGKPAPTAPTVELKPVQVPLGKTQVSAPSPAPAPAPAAPPAATEEDYYIAAQEAAPLPVPAPALAAEEKAPFIPSGGGGAPTVAEPEPEPEPVPIAAPPSQEAPTVEILKAAIVEAWRRWKEWGSPLATGPTTSGNGSSEAVRRFRFIGLLQHPIGLDDRPGMRWIYVRKLAIEPFADLSYKFKPHTLKRGSRYEARMLSRLKEGGSRREVLERLVSMSFVPEKLVGLKRTMRLPGRPGASVALWYVVGTWGGVDSVTVLDDKFFFEDLTEVVQ